MPADESTLSASFKFRLSVRLLPIASAVLALLRLIRRAD